MPQAVPEFEFSEDALKVRQILYDYWCTRGHGPNLRAVHEATGFPRERILAVYRELDLGLICTVDHDSQNGNLLKMQPFSSYPSQVEVHLEGKFHCWAGCAMESVAISRMPPFAGTELRLESYCACCLAPVTLTARDGAILSRRPDAILIHVSTSPRDWNKTNIVAMCDSMNYVLDAEHALRFERQTCRRGVVFTLEQAQRFVADTGKNRMWHYAWPPARVVPERIIAGVKALGVDVANWGG
jgi:hypothetical protein